MKRVISVLLFLCFMVSCFSMGVNAASLRKLDLAFVIDTTGSMGDDIAEVKANMEEYLRDLDESKMDYRIAIVDYRDFAARAGLEDYPYNVALDFSSDYDAILSAIHSLSLGYGGDTRETICSALIDGLDELSWRNEAGKAAILMGDAPALDPEPYTGYTKDQAINKLLYDDTAYEEDLRKSSKAMSVNSHIETQADSEKRSAVILFAVATDTDSSVVEDFEYLANGTGGKSYIADSSVEISEIIEEIINTIPDIVEDNEISFWQKLLNILKKIFWFITFQWKKVWPSAA